MRVLAIFTCYNRRELTKQSMELLGQNKNVTFDYVIVNHLAVFQSIIFGFSAQGSSLC